MHLSRRIAGRANVLSHGNLVLAAPAADLRDDLSLVQASYLGEADLVPTTEGPHR
jgi:ABC-type branched-subunit amino acid transport system ATPase component